MTGSRPMTNDEIEAVLSHLKTKRDRCMLLLGLYTGFRISEVLSIRLVDVVQYGAICDSITVTRMHMKGKMKSRTVVLHPKAKEAISDYVGSCEVYSMLFPISRIQAHRLLKKAVVASQLTGKVSTHSMRKTFAKRVYEALDKDLVATQRALGHESIQSTVSYLSFDQESIDNAIRGV